MAATVHPPVAPVEPAGGLVRLLEVDPELGAALEPDLQESVVPVSTEWSVLEPTRLALLDRAFALSAARWPEVVGELHGRTAARAFRLSVQMAICQLPRVELRLMLALWHLAERFGRVGPDGVTLPLPLSHRVLGQVVGARRPTVTLALTRLHQAGLVAR